MSLLSSGVLKVGAGYAGYSSHWYLCMVHFFVVCGYQGVEEFSERLSLADELLNAILTEAQVFCVGLPMLIVEGFEC